MIFSIATRASQNGLSLAILAVLVVAIRSRTLLARDPAGQSALAEQLFNEARELSKANRWAEACPKFEASLRYDPVLGTRLNLATCYEHVGRLARARGLYRESIELATPACDSDCTLPVCGDGHVNVALEDCDDGTGRDSVSCDSDCTLPVCGDGHVNAAAGEQCDFGPSNGSGSCSLTCKLQ